MCTGLQFLALKPGLNPETKRGSGLRELLTDKYILVAAGAGTARTVLLTRARMACGRHEHVAWACGGRAGAITFGNLGIAMLEPSLPLWMECMMDASPWQQGLAFLPCSVSYMLGTNIFGSLAHRIGRCASASATTGHVRVLVHSCPSDACSRLASPRRWRTSLIGLVVISLCLFVVCPALPCHTAPRHATPRRLIAPTACTKPLHSPQSTATGQPHRTLHAHTAPDCSCQEAALPFRNSP